MVKIQINGVAIEARDGATVIEAADEAGIVIPRFCYHKKLSIAANCRMCLVEVEKVAKPLPACATPVTDGMKVYTRSPKALAAQRAVMEFLLINHPLDCPICDQGGECDLQEMAIGFGKDVSRYGEEKRVVPSKNLGPLIATDMMRCIHCTRCVRFGQEIAGIMELGGVGRGEHTRIGTYIERSVDSELSGNVIDLCPVGALTSKPYRYTARPWELSQSPSVSPHDCVGANLTVETRNGKVMRVVPQENDEVNEQWLADRDRFSYTALNHAERLTAPMVKREGRWEETDWDTALTAVAEGLRKVRRDHGAERIGALGAYTATVEELYLLQRIARTLGSNNVDHRLRQQDFRDQDSLPVFPSLGTTIQDLEGVRAALVIGSNIRKDQPLLAHRLRKAGLAGAALMFINPVDFDFAMPVSQSIVVSPSAMARELGAVAKALLEQGGEAPRGMAALLQGIAVTDAHRAMARRLCDSGNAVVLLGNIATARPDAAVLRSLAATVARLSGARFGQIPEGGNGAGAALAGMLPHRSAGGRSITTPGLDWRAMCGAGMKGIVLLGIEPEHDSLDPLALTKALDGAEFVVSLASYANETAFALADVLLPVSTFMETSGTFVNGEGRWQSFAAAAKAPGQVRPAWKVLRVLGNLLDMKDCEYMSSEEVRDELHGICMDALPVERPVMIPDTLAAATSGIERVPEFPIYGVDAMVRRAAPLQATADGRRAGVSVHPETAAALGLSSADKVVVRAGEYQADLPFAIDARVAKNSAVIPTTQTGGLALGTGPVCVELRQG